MHYGIYSDYDIRRLELKGKRSILIRALEPSYKEKGIPYKIYNLNDYVDVLELYFEDIWEIVSEKAYERFTLFNEDMARELIDFITRNDFDEVIVHCSAGISRSSALMICVARILNMPKIEREIVEAKIDGIEQKMIETEDNDFKRFYPNKLVLSVFDKVFKKQKKIKNIILLKQYKIFLMIFYIVFLK